VLDSKLTEMNTGLSEQINRLTWRFLFAVATIVGVASAFIKYFPSWWRWPSHSEINVRVVFSPFRCSWSINILQVHSTRLYQEQVSNCMLSVAVPNLKFKIQLSNRIAEAKPKISAIRFHITSTIFYYLKFWFSHLAWKPLRRPL